MYFWFGRLPVPVISVGNLTWGGNGKTPMVEFIARWLAESGISPLILTRVLLIFLCLFLFWKLGLMGVYKFSIFDIIYYGQKLPSKWFKRISSNPLYDVKYKKSKLTYTFDYVMWLKCVMWLKADMNKIFPTNVRVRV